MDTRTYQRPIPRQAFEDKMKNYDALSDEELVDLFRLGEREAFVRIFNKYWAPLVLHVNNLLKDEDMAQDIVQDLFAWLIKSADKLEIKSTLKSYLYSAVRLKVLNAIKHEKTKNNYLEKIIDHVPVTHADSDFRLKELINLIDAEILKMPPKMQEIFNLSRKQHLSQKEIAQLLNISENTVKKQIQRALQSLRRNEDIDTYLAILTSVIVGLQK